MPLISPIGRRVWRVRVLLGGIVLVLSLGSLSMVLPFLLMLSGATKTSVDQFEFTLVPRFLRDDTALYRKFIEGRFNESLSGVRAAYGLDLASFQQLQAPRGIDETELARFHAYLKGNPPSEREQSAGFLYAPASRILPWNLRQWRRHLQRRFDGNIEGVNRTLEMDFVNWNAILVIPRDRQSRLGALAPGAWDLALEAWAADLPGTDRVLHSLEGYFRESVLVPALGRARDLPPLTATAPEDPELQRHWAAFVRHGVHPAYLRVEADAAPAFHLFLEARYGELDTLNRVWQSHYRDWQEIPLPERCPDVGAPRADWITFVEGWAAPGSRVLLQAPLDSISLDALDFRYAAWCREQGWTQRVEFPSLLQAYDYRIFQENRAALRTRFLVQNFLAVGDVLLRHGRGLLNTFIYCSLAVLLALIVNPLAAYALSRFRPRHTYSLLLFLLLTMAFPPMVTQIPVFLMLRDFGLLNTFAALLLPGMAHGYSIFLLKGFFDSLPASLYESASLDGAGEFRMFWTLTMSLSKPILAVIALGAFVNAYTNFMFALLICQDERMWTLMVWLFQLQQTQGTGVMQAAFVLAALPTLAVFLLCQRFIIRGIVIPVEK